MQVLRAAALVVFLPALCHGGDVVLKTTPLINSTLYNKARAEKEVFQRIETGIYDGYEAELCIDDSSRCNSDVFQPYKKVADGQTKYLLTIQRSAWDGIPMPVRDAAVREILYNTWGHAARAYSPLDVIVTSDTVETSPLAYLSPNSSKRYLHFASPKSLLGGVGGDSYGPNCWYNAISAIVDGDSAYARSQMLATASWNSPRFMGPTEFRQHMRNFTKVTEPRFGDIIRYYTDDPIYGGYRNLVYGGEGHAAVYVGKETYLVDGKNAVREIALTKDGRSDLDFLIFQDVRGLDEDYIPSPQRGAPGSEVKTQIKKGYFRVNRGASVLDPTTAGRLADAHGAYLVDIRNYVDRWLCLAKLIDPPVGDNSTCYSYPKNWITLHPDASGAAAPLAPELKLMKTQKARLLNLVDPIPSRVRVRVRSSG